MYKISVIIPVYNVEAYLRQCLDSVLGQSFTEFEIICIDDCSTDSSLKILYEYSEKDDRLHVLTSKENQGVYFARNRGLDAAEGKYIYFLDADDWILPNALQVMWEKAEQYNTDVILFNSSIYKEEVGLTEPSLNWNMGSQYDSLMTGEEAFCAIVEKNVWASSLWRQFWKYDFLKDNQIKFDNRKASADRLFSTVALLLAEKVVFIDMILHKYRRYIQSLSFVHDAEMLKCSALNYMCLLPFWMSHTFSPKTNYWMKIYMDRLARGVRNMHVQFADVFSSDLFDNFVYRHLYQIITDTEPIFRLGKHLDRDFVDKLKGYKNIYIYGASGYAIEMYEQLKKWNVEIQGFVVTGYTKANSIYNYPVCKLEDICLENNEVLFVLGITSKNQQDVIDNLEKHGFKNYLSLECREGNK